MDTYLSLTEEQKARLLSLNYYEDELGVKFIADPEEGKIIKLINDKFFEHHSYDSSTGYDRVCLNLFPVGYFRVKAHRFMVMLVFGIIDLPRHYHIHHINGDKLNNKILNLLICASSSVHKKVEGIQRVKDITHILNEWASDGKIVTLDDVNYLKEL